jgi:predicted ferric reductase
LVILYLFFILAPLFALLAGTLPPTRDFWTEFSVAIGYAGLAMMGLQFGLTARFRTSPSRGARTLSITFTARSR